MYGVVAHFDQNTELYIKQVWKELSDNAVSKYAEEVQDRRSHITIAGSRPFYTGSMERSEYMLDGIFAFARDKLVAGQNMTIVSYGDRWTYGSVADGWYEARDSGWDRELIHFSWVM